MAQATLKAILFDMDDTLIDWSQREWNTYRQDHLELVYNYVNADVHPLAAPDDFYETVSQLFNEAWTAGYQGSRAPHVGSIMAQALQNMGVPADRIDHDAMLKAYNWGPVKGVVVFPDALEVLPIISAANIKTAIVTNSAQPMWMRDIELRAYGLLDHFIDCRLSAADVGYLKPHRAIFEAALNCLNVQPDEAIFVGDNPEADIAGAQSMGMRAVLRIIPSRKVTDREILDKANIIPNGTIDTLHDLLALLDSWYPGWRIAPQP